MKLFKIFLAVALLTVLAGVAAAEQKPQQPNPPSGADASVGPAPILVIESLNEGKADLLINNVSPG